MHSSRSFFVLFSVVANQLCCSSAFAHDFAGSAFAPGHNTGASMNTNYQGGYTSSAGSSGRQPQSPTPLPWRGGPRPYNPPEAGTGPLYCIPNYQGDDRLNNHQGRDANSGYDSSGIFYRPGGPIYGTDYTPPTSDYIPGQVTPASGGWQCSGNDEMAGPRLEGSDYPGAGSHSQPPANSVKQAVSGQFGMLNPAFKQVSGMDVTGSVLP